MIGSKECMLQEMRDESIRSAETEDVIETMEVDWEASLMKDRGIRYGLLIQSTQLLHRSPHQSHLGAASMSFLSYLRWFPVAADRPFVQDSAVVVL